MEFVNVPGLIKKHQLTEPGIELAQFFVTHPSPSQSSVLIDKAINASCDTTESPKIGNNHGCDDDKKCYIMVGMFSQLGIVLPIKNVALRVFWVLHSEYKL